MDKSNFIKQQDPVCIPILNPKTSEISAVVVKDGYTAVILDKRYNMKDVVKHEYDRLRNIKIIRARTVYDSCIGQAQELRNLDLINEYEFAELYDHLTFVFEHADSIEKSFEREDN